MCGIAGIISKHEGKFSIDDLRKMMHALAHRGPDGEKTWINPTGNALLGHRRLAIIDLSEEAAQPMHWQDRYSIVHNGELYNYLEIKSELSKKGYSFRTKSDTEVILAAYDHWKENCLPRFNGMFGFAIWDEKDKQLFAARDRFGEKPFYYSFDGKENFFFASEFKALLSLLPRNINEKMLLNYLALGYQSGKNTDQTFYKGIKTLKPAQYLQLHFVSNSGNPVVEINNYWDFEIAQDSISEKEALGEFQKLFQGAVKLRHRADVSIGTSLSGGLDSSSIVATSESMQEANNSHTCFTASFPGYEKDETKYAKQVAERFSLKHFTNSINAEDLVNDLDKFIGLHQEPIGSSSVYAQYKVFELAKDQNIKVLLDGQGADELLAGYHKYIHWYLQELLVKDHSLFQKEVNALSDNSIWFEWSWRNRLAARFPAAAASWLRSSEIQKLRKNPDLNEEYKKTFFDQALIYKPMAKGLNDTLLYNAFGPWLGELLRYADRNSMAHGRELRLPFLDHKLAEFLITLPSSFKIKNGWTKWLLRKSMEASLPNEITWRKDKTGFEPPQESWMKNEKLQERIRHAKQVLVKERILKEETLHKKIQPHSAYAADGFDWRYLVAGTLLEQRNR